MEDQIMHDVSKLQIPVYRPVRETLLRAPDKFAGTARLRAETLRHDLQVQCSTAHFRMLVALLVV